MDTAFLLIGLILGGAAVFLVTRSQFGESRRALEIGAEKARELEARLDQSQSAEADLRVRLAGLEATLSTERRQTEEKLAVWEDAQRRLSDAFKALAADALKNSNESFLSLAKNTLERFQESAKGDLEHRQKAIGELVSPLCTSLEKFDERFREVEKMREGAYQGLREHLTLVTQAQEKLSAETSNLVNALRRPTVRGRWGEIQLRRVVELSGMVIHCDFSEQLSYQGEAGLHRPDMTVHLPGGRSIVVDSKVPLDAYLSAVDAVDEPTRKARLLDHARQVRAHIKQLGRKDYFEKVDLSPEFVVLFLPGDQFFSAAVEHDSALIEYGMSQNVIIATPSTLIALLRAVGQGWRQDQLAQSAQKVSELGKELYERLGTLADHWGKVGHALRGATEAYNAAVGSLEGRVLVSARRFRELGVGTGQSEIRELGPVENLPRDLQAPELALLQEATLTN